MKRLILVAVLFSLGVSGVFGSPDARMGAGFVYDDVNGRCVLVSGAWDTGHGWSGFNDMWVLEDGVWSELTVSGLPASNNFEMGYSGDDEVVVVFTNDNDYTLVYDVAGNRWSRLRHSDGPIRRGDAGFCYDPVNGVFVLFGGMTDDVVDIRILNDTWVYDVGSDTWSEMSPVVSPPRCYGCRLVWDSVNERLLLWGGNMPDSTGAKMDDWWCYDYPSNTWTLIESEGKPSMRYWQYMAFDPRVGKVVVFGGKPLGDTAGDTWLYDYALNEWSRVEPVVSPSPRQSGAMVYDASIGRVVLFGGLDADMGELGDTWVFDSVAGEWSTLEASISGIEEEDVATGIPGFPLVSVLVAFMCLVLAGLGYSRLDSTDSS